MIIPTKKAGDFALPVLGFGTWELGGRFEADEQVNQETDIQAIKNALAAGLHHLDTAEAYAEGRAERFVARAIRGVMTEKSFLSPAKSGPITYIMMMSSLQPTAAWSASRPAIWICT